MHHWLTLACWTQLTVAEKLGVDAKVGDIFAADRFYNDELDMKKLRDYGILGTEMESAGCTC